MTHSQSPQAFADAGTFLDRALEQDIGSSALFELEKNARTFQNRCYVARVRDRTQNAKIYSEDMDALLYKRSVWDKLRLKVSPEDKDAYAFAEKIREEAIAEAKRALDQAKEDLQKSQDVVTAGHDHSVVIKLNHTNLEKYEDLYRAAKEGEGLSPECYYNGRWALLAIHDATILIEDGVEIIDHNHP